MSKGLGQLTQMSCCPTTPAFSQPVHLSSCVRQHHLHLAGLLQVLPGARIPADGVVVAGRSHVDESMLTGESLPVNKQPGDEAIGGTVNMGGPLQVRAPQVGSSAVRTCRPLAGMWEM